jgi:hypothetical protein
LDRCELKKRQWVAERGNRGESEAHTEEEEEVYEKGKTGFANKTTA